MTRLVKICGVVERADHHCGDDIVVPSCVQDHDEPVLRHLQDVRINNITEPSPVSLVYNNGDCRLV